MIVTQRGVLPPVQFLELDSSLRNSILAPAGTKTVASTDLDATMLSSQLTPAGARKVAVADLDATMLSSQLAPAGARAIVTADMASGTSADFIEAGSVPIIWTGFASDPGGLLFYCRVGRICLLTFSGQLRTGNASNIRLDFATLPASVRASSNNPNGINVAAAIINNGIVEGGSIQMTRSVSTTRLTLSRYAGSFSLVGENGLLSNTFSYIV